MFRIVISTYNRANFWGITCQIVAFQNSYNVCFKRMCHRFFETDVMYDLLNFWPHCMIFTVIRHSRQSPLIFCFS